LQIGIATEWGQRVGHATLADQGRAPQGRARSPRVVKRRFIGLQSWPRRPVGASTAPSTGHAWKEAQHLRGWCACRFTGACCPPCRWISMCTSPGQGAAGRADPRCQDRCCFCRHHHRDESTWG